jgi:hypothetical protein
MSASEEDTLEQLSSEELHDMAVNRAKHHLDVKFFYNLAQVLPAAEMAAGNPEDAEADVMMLRAHLDDITESGRGEVAELLRPFYIDYLRKHGIHGK